MIIFPYLLSFSSKSELFMSMANDFFYWVTNPVYLLFRSKSPFFLCLISVIFIPFVIRLGISFFKRVTK